MLNVLSSAGASILGLGYLIPLVYLLWSLKLRPDRRAEPVGRQGSRVEDDVAAADAQLREHAGGDRRGLQLRGAGGKPSWLISLRPRLCTTPGLAHHFDSLEQQADVASLGMWVFLVTEVLFFGGMFTSYLVYRSMYPHAFAVASEHTLIALGALNTAILITSSLTMALAVYASQEGDSKGVFRFLVLTWILGAGFLGVKGIEYATDFHEHLVPGAHFAIEGANAGHAQLFFSLYFIMTGLHAIHMIVGLSILLVMMYMARKGKFTPGVPHSDGSDRSLLALRRHRVDLPVPAAVPDRPSQVTR